MTSLVTETTGIAPGQLPRLLALAGNLSLDAHLARLGPLPARDPGLIAEVERAGLRGRGGAGFPTAIKMAAVAKGRRTVVVANGTEGEPASRKDKTLLTLAPHLILDGAVAAARAVGAGEVIVAVERSETAVLEALGQAMAQRAASGVDRGVQIRAAATPNRYVAGEESALVHWLNGGDAKPTFVPPRPFERGVRGRPTLVDNVETLAHVALIARYGGDWYRTVGTGTDPGSALVTVSGGASRPGVYEIAKGTPMVDVLTHAGAPIDSVQAVLVGGYFGTWIPAGDLPGLALSDDSLRQVGSSFGCGALAVLPQGACGLIEAARVTRWLASQNAGQCGPCVLGLPAIAGAMEALVRGDHSQRALQDLGRWTELVKGRGACKHPDGVARFVDSSLRVFAPEIELHHRRKGRCRDHAPILPVPAPGGWR